jgi:hypothetical protein
VLMIAFNIHPRSSSFKLNAFSFVLEVIIVFVIDLSFV